MRVYTLKELETMPEGSLSLAYGPTGVGKTVSTLKTAPDPLMYIRSEPRETKRSLRAVNRPDLRLKVADHDNFDDLVEFLADDANLKGCRSIILDSVSHLMNVRLAHEILGQAWESKLDKEKDKVVKKLAAQSKMTQEGYGIIANCMIRLCGVFMDVAVKNGIHVIMLSLEESHPKWNRELVGAPAFIGKMFSDNFPGFFDLIGRVSNKKNPDTGVIQYPPKIAFRAPDDDFTAKATGGMTKFTWPLNWSKILSEG